METAVFSFPLHFLFLEDHIPQNLFTYALFSYGLSDLLVVYMYLLADCYRLYLLQYDLLVVCLLADCYQLYLQYHGERAQAPEDLCSCKYSTVSLIRWRSWYFSEGKHKQYQTFCVNIKINDWCGQLEIKLFMLKIW